MHPLEMRLTGPDGRVRYVLYRLRRTFPVTAVSEFFHPDQRPGVTRVYVSLG